MSRNDKQQVKPGFSITWFARHFPQHRNTISEKIKSAGVSPVGFESGNPIYDVYSVSEILLSDRINFPGHDDFDPETMHPKDRKDWYDGETKRIEIQKRKRELVPADEVEEVVSTAFSVVSQSLLSLPDLLERECALNPEQIDACRASVHGALSDLAKNISSLAVVGS